MSINWVMLQRDGGIVPIPNESILHTSRQRTGFELTTPRELQVAEPFAVKSDSGIVYITNQRVIYLPARPTDTFQSFFAPVMNFSDTHVQSSWIGPWSWGGVVRPVPGGGIPMDIPRVEVKFTFKDGGHSDFQQKFEWLKERLQHARELGVEPSQNLEPPPPYDPSSAPGPSPSGPGEAAAAPGSSPPEPRQNQPTPDEPPPDYIEAQSQAMAIQYEERAREEAERK